MTDFTAWRENMNRVNYNFNAHYTYTTVNIEAVFMGIKCLCLYLGEDTYSWTSSFQKAYNYRDLHGDLMRSITFPSNNRTITHDCRDIMRLDEKRGNFITVGRLHKNY